MTEEEMKEIMVERFTEAYKRKVRWVRDLRQGYSKKQIERIIVRELANLSDYIRVNSEFLDDIPRDRALVEIVFDMLGEAAALVDILSIIDELPDERLERPFVTHIKKR